MAESSRSHEDGGMLYVEEAYFSALFDDNEKFPVSDEKFALELQLQEALVSSTISSPIFRTLKNNNIRTVHIKQEEVINNGPGKGKEIAPVGASRVSLCPICMNPKPAGEMFRSSSCSHSFCTECMGMYVSTRIRDNISDLICPNLNCRVKLDPSNCRGFVPKEVFEMWDNALCESMILASEKFYCPYKDCSALLVGEEGGRRVIESECPNCHRLFCAQCKVPWHSGLSCEEFIAGAAPTFTLTEEAM